jgi:hypothetical protein
LTVKSLLTFQKIDHLQVDRKYNARHLNRLFAERSERGIGILQRSLPADDKNEGGGKSKLEIGFETMILIFEQPMTVLT